MSDKSFFVFWIFWIGLFFFYNGFKAIKRRRQLLAIPTSQIDSAPIGGLVEIEGNIVCDPTKIHTSPLSNEKCAAFYWEIEKLVSGRKSSTWRTVGKFYSNYYILLNDGGQFNAAIDLKDSTFIGKSCKHVLKFKNKSAELPLAVEKILSDSKTLTFDNKSAGFFSFKHKFMITEYRFPVSQKLYVLGESYPKDKMDFKKSFNDSYMSHKKDPKVIKEYDLNGDLKLDAEESKAMSVKVKQELLKGFDNGTNDEQMQQTSLFIKRSNEFNILFNTDKVVVSFKSQAQTLKKLTIDVYGFIIVGTLLVGLAIYIALRL